MLPHQDRNLPHQVAIETRWLKMVNEIQQKHNVLINMIEKLEQNPATNQKIVFQLTHLQQRVLDTLNSFLAESCLDHDAFMPAQLSERLQKKKAHSQVLIRLTQEIDTALNDIGL
ncbi:hypothetical protein ACO2Q8_17945 [Larkinella sp. VNQ87]|uniref:hypothetical protein n=1 Tax=Larkinella sp. VNQ87 TaxID=3400921 RepID=UPI003C072E65